MPAAGHNRAMAEAAEATSTHRQPVLLRERSTASLWRAILVWATTLLVLTWATEHLARRFGGGAVAVVWTSALMLGVLAARLWKRAIHRQPRLLLFRGEELAVIDRAGREITREPTDHVRVQRGRHRVGGVGVRVEPALSVRLPGLPPIVIGALGLGYPTAPPTARLKRPRYVVGPDEWRALVRCLRLEPAV